MHYVIQRTKSYELIKDVEFENKKIVSYKKVKNYPIKIFETLSDNLGILEIIKFIKKEENLPFLDIKTRIIKERDLNF